MEYNDFILLTIYNTQYGNLKVENNKLYLYEKESMAEDFGCNILNFLLKIIPSILLQDYKDIKAKAYYNNEQSEFDDAITYFEEKVNLKTVYNILMEKNLLNQYKYIEQEKCDSCDKETFFNMLYTMESAYPEDLKISDDCLYISKHALYLNLKHSSENEQNIKDMFNIAFDFNGINDRKKFNSFLTFYKSAYDENAIGTLSEASEECKTNKNFKKIELNNLYACFLSTREYKPQLILEEKNETSFKM